jgi:hypothetical protein
MISLVFALSLMAAAPDDGGEPLPPSAPADSYELSAWCYGALGEYLTVYETVKPDLRDIDRMFGTSVVEDEPYHADMAAARDELKMIGESVTAAEKASPKAISPRGVAAMRQGEGIWAVAEAKTHRELARAWLSWAMPDRCDSNARELIKRSAILGKALSYNNGPGAIESAASTAPAAAPATLETTSRLTAGSIGYVGATGVAAPAPLAAPSPAPVTSREPEAALPPDAPVRVARTPAPAAEATALPPSSAAEAPAPPEAPAALAAGAQPTETAPPTSAFTPAPATPAAAAPAPGASPPATGGDAPQEPGL